jgi:hypothetical protein
MFPEQPVLEEGVDETKRLFAQKLRCKTAVLRRWCDQCNFYNRKSAE